MCDCDVCALGMQGLAGGRRGVKAGYGEGGRKRVVPSQGHQPCVHMRRLLLVVSQAVRNAADGHRHAAAPPRATSTYAQPPRHRQASAAAGRGPPAEAPRSMQTSARRQAHTQGTRTTAAAAAAAAAAGRAACSTMQARVLLDACTCTCAGPGTATHEQVGPAYIGPHRAYIGPTKGLHRAYIGPT